LPIRVPMTARPPVDAGVGAGPPSVGAGAPVAVPAAREAVEPDRDSAMLAALYRGIREADENRDADQSSSHPAGRKG
jgi:hypothetical protein